MPSALPPPAPRKRSLFFAAFGLAAACLLLPACQTIVKRATKVPPPDAPTAYHATPPSQGFTMRRVAFLPLASDNVAPESLRDVEKAFSSELTKEGYFEVVTVSRTELETITGERQLSSVRPLPADLLSRLQQRFGAEGVLFVDLTHFSAYRPVAIGVRAKLVDVSTGKIQWAVDHVYDTGNPSEAAAAKTFQQQFANDHRALADDGGSVLLSPARFARYVAAATFSTLRNGGATARN